MARLGQRKRDDIHETPDVSHIQNPDVSHEASDVNVGSIIKFVGGLFVLTVVTFLLMKLLFKVLEDRASKLDPPARPMALTDQERLPPEPRLQGAPGFGVQRSETERVPLQLREPQAEYRELRKIWDGVLKGEPDPRTGKAGISIDEAMKKVAEDGSLRSCPPGDNQEQIDVRGGMNVPSYQSSGRMPEKRD